MLVELTMSVHALKYCSTIIYFARRLSRRLLLRPNNEQYSRYIIHDYKKKAIEKHQQQHLPPVCLSVCLSRNARAIGPTVL